jgi:hypothetical protein
MIERSAPALQVIFPYWRKLLYNGLDNAEPRTPQSTIPTSFRQWCEDVLKPVVLA